MKTNALAITALALGGAAFLTGLIPVLGMLLGAAGITLGVIALTKGQNKPMSIIGAVAGTIGAITSLIALLVVIAVIPALDEPTPVAQPTQSAEATPEATTTPTETPAETPEPVEPEAPALAPQVEAELLTQLGTNSFPEGLTRDPNNLLFYIANIEDHNTSTVRITIQSTMTKDDATLVGERAFNLVGQQIPDLDTIIITDQGGVDRANIYRADLPLLRG